VHLNSSTIPVGHLSQESPEVLLLVLAGRGSSGWGGYKGVVVVSEGGPEFWVPQLN
jgi:hypothetical protein